MIATLRSTFQLALSMISPGRPAPSRPRRTRLGLEELETRTLLSAAGLSVPNAAPQFTLTPLAAAASAPYSPAQVRHAYGFDKLSYDGAGETIAIVDAYDDPKITADLHTFDKAFGLADPSLAIATPQGKPAGNHSDWAGETDLDVEWAHAIAPKAKILLVEALSPSDADLRNAVDYARRQPGVVAVSMSWGGSEFSTELGYDATFTTPAGHAGVAFVASAGDIGAGAQWPAVSPNVLAVGGTSLTITSNGTRISETGWSSGGGGLSKYESEQPFQRSVQGSGKRSTPDVAYNADTNKGFYVYDSVPDQYGQTGWFSYGGTSAGAPQWAALIAVADQARAAAGLGSLSNIPAAIYSLPAWDFNDVTAGNNGFQASSGYDLVTGRGSPKADLIVAGLMNYGAVSPAASKTVPVKPAVQTTQTKALVRASEAGERPVGVPTNRAAEVLAGLLRDMHGLRPHEGEEDFGAPRRG
jgi:subtilase family serine protease